MMEDDYNYVATSKEDNCQTRVSLVSKISVCYTDPGKYKGMYE